MFEETDWEGISQISVGSKKRDKSSIGQFGLGFNTVYHLGEVVEIISGDTFTIFDTQEKYVTQRLRNKRSVLYLVLVASFPHALQV